MCGRRQVQAISLQVDEITWGFMRRITILSTGGTIEKSYVEASGTVKNLGPKLPDVLKQLRSSNVEIVIESVMDKDSLDLTASDLLALLVRVWALSNQQIPVIVTHGTDTMAQTAAYLEQNLIAVDIPVVLTGAMVPLGFENSDAMQNITESVMAIQFVKPGFYIVMHGECHRANQVKKDVESSRFVSSE